MPDARTLIRCFLRTYLVGAAFNTRGMQNIGLVFAMEPGLKALYPDPKKRRDARKRYMRHYNTHPFWTPLLIGTFLSLEGLIAAGKVPPKMLTTLKDTTTYSLSAIGDSVFGGSFLVFWSLSTCALLVSGQQTAAWIYTLLLFTALQIFKLFTFAAGLQQGLKVLAMLKSWNLINWGERLKLVNALFVVLLLYLIWPGNYVWNTWGVVCVTLTALAWLIDRFHLSRIIIIYCLTLAAMALPLLGFSWPGLTGN